MIIIDILFLAFITFNTILVVAIFYTIKKLKKENAYSQKDDQTIIKLNNYFEDLKENVNKIIDYLRIEMETFKANGKSSFDINSSQYNNILQHLNIGNNSINDVKKMSTEIQESLSVDYLMKKEREDVVKWLEEIEKVIDIDSKIDLLSKVFSRYSYNKVIFDLYLNSLYTKLNNNPNIIGNYSAIFSLVDVYMRFCEPGEYGVLNAEKVKIKHLSEEKLNNLTNEFNEKQKTLFEQLEDRVNKLDCNIHGSQNNLLEIKELDESINRDFIKSNDIKERYKKILLKVNKLSNNIEDIEYSRNQLKKIHDIHNKFSRNKTPLKYIPQHDKKAKNNDDLYDNEEPTLSKDDMENILSLEDINESILVPEVLRYLIFAKGDIFNKMNKKEKFIITTKQLDRR